MAIMPDSSVNRGRYSGIQYCLLLFGTVRCSVFLYWQMLMAGAAQSAELWCGMPCAPSRLQRSSKGMEAILQLQLSEGIGQGPRRGIGSLWKMW
jgi:hypothetical protein